MTAPVPDHAALTVEELRRRLRLDWRRAFCANGVHDWKVAGCCRGTVSYCRACGTMAATSDVAVSQ